MAALVGNLSAVVLDMADGSTICLSLICMHSNNIPHINIMMNCQCVTFSPATKFRRKI